MTMKKNHLAMLLSWLLCLTAEAQTTHTGVFTPNLALTTPHTNIGLIGTADTLRGVQFNLLSSTAIQSRGVQLSTVLSAAKSARGVQWAGVTSVADSLRGMQLSSMNNIVLSPLHGLQLSGVSNVAMGVEKGTQLAAVNLAANTMRGAQIGLYNYADTATGVQVGLVNAAHEHPRGWQVGFVNFSKDGTGRRIGFVNISPQTQIDYLFYAGNTSKMNAAIRFRNKSTYSIVGVGTHYMGLDEHFSGALFYRLGQFFQLSPRWSVSGDVGYYHVETFEENSTTKPERLFSLQAHVNADYQINRTLGLYASLGYGRTNYYAHHRKYKDGLVAQLGLSIRYHRDDDEQLRSFDLVPGDATTMGDVPSPYGRKRPWLAAAEVTGINLLVHSFDRFVLDAHYAQVTMHSIRRNFKQGFVWDNDGFPTNLFAHPYHGNLYFNSARACGLNFWESTPYALCGSLMWEFAGECEPPSPNDVLATSFGGISIGEVTNRLSDLLLDEDVIGFPRFLREAAALLVCPMKGFNRLVTGKAWKHGNGARMQHVKPDNLSLQVTLGDRYVADDGALFRGEQQPFVALDMEYGDAIGGRGNKPYDFFHVNLGFGVGGSQPLINNIHLIGRLWATPTNDGKKMDTEVGFFQHFDYYNSEPIENGTGLIPFRLSEAAAVGPGFVVRYKPNGFLRHIEQRTFISGILLGGSKSDYFHNLERDYNLGSGYSVKLHTNIAFGRTFGLRLLAERYQIFTWKGYEKKDLETINPTFLNAQGDKGNAQLTVLIAQLNVSVSKSLSIEFAGSYFTRDSHYKYYEDVHADTFEVRAGLAWKIN